MLSLVLCILYCVSISLAQVPKYGPCPLLGPFLPPPRIDASSPALQSALDDLTSLLDQYVEAGDGDFGPITPNTTSFSIALFAGSNYSAEKEDPKPYFFQYHYTAAEASDDINTDSIFATADITQLFTVLAVLIEEGDGVWGRSIVEYLPKLADLQDDDAIKAVDWSEVTLGALASHMAGITRETDACAIDQPCSRDEFLRNLASRPPIELPDTTPIYSNAAFQLLALALESKSGQSISSIIAERILHPLQMSDSAFLKRHTVLTDDGLNNGSVTGEPAALGLSSSITDLSRFGHAILTSELVSPVETRRWLKPVTGTSNLRNAVGRPWDIYHFGTHNTVNDIFTKSGSVGRYSSYFGLVPSYDVGFAILAVNSQGEAPDLNAYADITLGGLLQIDELGSAEANETLVGRYKAGDGESILNIALTGSDPGLAITTLTVDGKDWLANIAELAGIDKTEYLDLRVYPTNLQKEFDSGSKQQVFQAVIQDKSALVDAGTSTCISWQTVGELEREGVPLDRFVGELDERGVAVAVDWPTVGVRYKRTS